MWCDIKCVFMQAQRHQNFISMYGNMCVCVCVCVCLHACVYVHACCCMSLYIYYQTYSCKLSCQTSPYICQLVAIAPILHQWHTGNCNSRQLFLPDAQFLRRNSNLTSADHFITWEVTIHSCYLQTLYISTSSVSMHILRAQISTKHPPNSCC